MRTLLIAATLLAAPACSAKLRRPRANSRRGQPEDARLARRMSEEVRRLADDVAADLGRTRGGAYLLADVRELGQALEDYRRDRRAGASTFEVRRNYAGIQQSWLTIRSQLSRTGTTTPTIQRDLERIDVVESELEHSLGLRPRPEILPIPDRAPEDWVAVNRLARGLLDRAEALSLAIDADLGSDRRRAGLAADAQALAREVDAWSQSLAGNYDLRLARRTYGTVDTLADRVERVVVNRAMPPRVAAAWVSFAQTELLVEQSLGFQGKPPVIIEASRPEPIPVPLPPPMLGLAETLTTQTAEFIQVFGPGARNVPDGEIMLNDARRLLAASQGFRQVAAQNADANALALAFRDVDAIWTRLARRVNRIARGRTGPNIQQVANIGVTCDQIHQGLGLAGFVPQVGPF